MKQQDGAAIIFCLIILAVLTAVGVASIQPSGLELKTISIAEDRALAFQAAETALANIEANLVNQPPPASAHFSECKGSECFNSRCDGGLCFSGEYYAGQKPSQCYVLAPDVAMPRDFWSDKTLAVWNTENRHRALTIESLKSPVKYIIEFLCFAHVGALLGTGITTAGATFEGSEFENYQPLYRITVMANGNTSRSSVVLQSTYRIAQNQSRTPNLSASLKSTQVVLSEVSGDLAATSIDRTTASANKCQRANTRPSDSATVRWGRDLGLYIHSPPSTTGHSTLFIDSQNQLREDSDQDARLTPADAVVALALNPASNTLMAQRYQLGENGQRGAELGEPVPWQHINALWQTHSSVPARQRYMFTAVDEDKDGVIFGHHAMVPFTEDKLRAHQQLRANTTDRARQTIRQIRSMPFSKSRASALMVNAPQASYDITFADKSYRTYRQQYRNRRSMLYSLGDTGLVYGFNAGFFDAHSRHFATEEKTLGAERWVYIPASTLPYLANPATNETTSTLVDGKLYAFDVNIFPHDTDHPGGWGTVLVVGVSRPLKSQSYKGDNPNAKATHSVWLILDVTNPEKHPRLIAEISAPTFNTEANVDVVKVRTDDKGSGSYNDNRWFLTFAASSSSGEETAKLHFYDLQKGALHTLDSGVQDAEVTGITVTDWDRDFIDDVIYYSVAGNVGNDNGGQLRRAILRFSANGVEFQDSAMLTGAGQHFSTAPYTRIDADYNYWVFAATGKIHSEPNGHQNTFYGLKEVVDGEGKITQALIDRNQLVSVDNIQTYDNGQVRTPSGGPVLINGTEAVERVDDVSKLVAKNAGWSLSLDHSGEAAIGTIRQYSTSLLLTTATPAGDACSFSQGSTRLYQREFFNGLTPTYSAFKHGDSALGAGEQSGQALSRVITLGNSVDTLMDDTGLLQHAGGAVNKVDLGKLNIDSRRESWREIHKNW
ncbi:MAG TPA: PilX N-terminal domain-containing pilus assembly protein [Marinagarivorans sp.]